MRPSLEDLFDRYRDRGDLRALARVFDRTARDLLAVAQHLVHDPNDAEDVLQATFVAAIERAAEFDVRRSLVAWLTGILARQAAAHRRREARVPDPRRLDARDVPAPGRRAEAREVEEALQRALARVPELYRGVLTPLLVDGKRPEEIARELERAPGTVRMQIHRGLEHLRRALPVGLTAAALGLVAPRGLAAVRGAVLARAAALAPAAAAAGAAGGALTLAGGTIVSKNLILGGLGAALCAGVLWVATQPGEATRAGVVADTERGAATASERSADRPARPVAPRSGAARRGEAVAAEPGADPAAADDARTVAEAGGWYLVGVARGLHPRHAADARVSVRVVVPPEAEDPPVFELVSLLRRRVEVNAYRALRDRAVLGAPALAGAPVREDGRFELDLGPLCAEGAGGRPVIAGGALAVVVSHPLYFDAEVLVDLGAYAPPEPGERVDVRADVDVRPAAVCVGRVAVAEATDVVRLLTQDYRGDPARAGGERVEGFTIQIAALSSGTYALDDMGLQLFVQGADARLVGLFPLAGGRPGPTPAAQVRWDGDGGFRLKVADAGRYALCAVRPGHRPVVELVDLALGRETDAGELGAPPAHAVEGFVDGGGLFGGAGFRVRAERVGRPGESTATLGDWSLVWTGTTFEVAGHEETTDERGAFAFEALAPEDYRLEVVGSDRLDGLGARFDEAAVTVRAPAAGVPLVVPACGIELTVVDSGAPLDEERLQEVEVVVRLLDDGVELDPFEPDEAGRLTLLCEVGVAYELEVRDGSAEPRSVRVTGPRAGTIAGVSVDLGAPPEADDAAQNRK